MERMLDDLFSNIGRKIQNIAKIAFVISLIAGLLCVVIELFSGFGYDGILLLIGLGGTLVSYLNCLFLCAIGQLVNDVHVVKNKLGDDIDSESFVLPEI